MGPLLTNYKNLGSVSVTGSNKVIEVVQIPLRVLQVGFMVTTALTTTAAKVAFNIPLSNGADADPVGDAALGVCTATSATMAVNTGVWLDVPAVQGNRIVFPGEAVEAEVTVTAGAGVVMPFFVYEPLGWGDNDLRSMEPAHAGSVDHATALAALTKVIA